MRDRDDRISRPIGLSILMLIVEGSLSLSAMAQVSVDLSAYREDCGVWVRREGKRLEISWPISAVENGCLAINLERGKPLIAGLGVVRGPKTQGGDILGEVDPVAFMTVGRRANPPDRPPSMSAFNVFFDSPAKRPFQRYRSRLNPRQLRVSSRTGRAVVAIDDLAIGPFSGAWEITVYANAPLIRIEAAVGTAERERAFVYDLGLVSEKPRWKNVAWRDVDGVLHRDRFEADTPLAVRQRTLVAESEEGSIACFPPPHQFFYPRDYTDNQKTVWAGRGHRESEPRLGFGIRQTETGGGNFAPWFNAPPGSVQRLSAFFLLRQGPAESALAEVSRYTHGDSFPTLPGRLTMTSHWHMAIAIAALNEIRKGGERTTPEFVKIFKDMNVNVVHLAEFHGDGRPRDPGPIRLPELSAMFAECRRLSDEKLLLLPGEEANTDLTAGKPGLKTGHWLYLFPHPVYWTMVRPPGVPFMEETAEYGKVYHIGNRDDLFRMLEKERGLAWTAHARIKSSSWTPDAYRDEEFFRGDRWLGAAWKAMPADLSQPKLGTRVLDLMDDMANWGLRKYVPGEVDVFKIDHTHELYGHMNINYLEVDRLPKFDDDWSPILDALRHGKFFTTTGEVLISEFAADGKPSGSSLTVRPNEPTSLRLKLSWTFPLEFAEIVSGDGRKVYRERIDLSKTTSFGGTTLELSRRLSERRWVRMEVWDVAANGAYTQPVWLLSESTSSR